MGTSALKTGCEAGHDDDQDLQAALERDEAYIATHQATDALAVRLCLSHLQIDRDVGWQQNGKALNTEYRGDGQGSDQPPELGEGEFQISVLNRKEPPGGRCDDCKGWQDEHHARHQPDRRRAW